ncbi:hypothetical protein BDR04DRAFT_1164519 [Suillus decipiens]|nr:hypothetical protein BDR04DRAFT_1164519 [Suillus decipiens]
MPAFNEGRLAPLLGPANSNRHLTSTYTIMPSDRRQVVVLYAEKKLQKSINLPANFTVTKAKEEGMLAIKDHMKILPGVPPISLDPTCTDFYPAPKDDNTIIRNLKGNLTMVVYPEPPEGQDLTPSPFVDALQYAIHEVRDLKTQQNTTSSIREESTNCNVKPADSVNDMLLRRFEAIEEKFGRESAALKQDIEELRRDNAELRRVNTSLQEDINEQGRIIVGLQDDVKELKRETSQLKQDNSQLKNDTKELSDQMDDTTRAVLGDKVAIDKIRRRVLLDMGRDQLAVLCGHKDWKEWKDRKAAGGVASGFQ